MALAAVTLPAPAGELIGTARFLKATGLTPRQMDHWTHRGVLCPAVPASGSGSRRMWPPDEVRVGRLLARIWPATLPVAVLGGVAAAVRGNPWARWVRVDPGGVTAVPAPS